MFKRIDYVDVFRGIGIIFMILGHMSFVTPHFDHYIHAFHMPMFYFASGLFFKTNLRITTYLKKLTKQIILPYVFFATIFSFIVVFRGEDTLKNVLSQVLTINNNGFPIAGALWFLTSFYFSQVILYILKKKINDDIVLTPIVVLSLIVGINFSKLFATRLYWSLDTSFVGLALIFLGYIVKKYNLLEKLISDKIGLTIILFLINCFLIMKTSYVNMRADIYPSTILFLINAVMSFLVYLNVSKIIIKYLFKTKFKKMLTVMGKNSIVSLCLNQFVILLFTKIFYKLKIDYYFLYVWHLNIIYYIVFSGIVILTLYFLSDKLINTRFKILFGK